MTIKIMKTPQTGSTIMTVWEDVVADFTTTSVVSTTGISASVEVSTMHL